MRRADRLFQIVQYLRGRRLTTAAQLADWLEVSQRTVYRDIQDLERTGVPIEGEAGVGYRLRPEFDMPPLMFTYEEVEALVAGARMIGSWGSPQLRQASELALAKIAAALPEARRIELERTRLYAMSYADPAVGDVLDTLRHVIAGRVVTLLDYKDAASQASTRHVWPLGLYFWGNVWSLAAWCELRRDFRNFRLDRIGGAFSTERQYPDEAGFRLEDFVRAMRSKKAEK
ncbi:helix-turn-helix transcriptional regulator [Nevskia soli]|uniref:helix-turn-helix transcriptional regulator n=1 Tax=Nevskia soli TaxID=418856 RepID=UPI0004A6D0FD|nr:YafY family protein [Nevskia soli]